MTTMSTMTEEVRQGVRNSWREQDVITQALGNAEHPGRTRGHGVYHWKITFQDEISSYRRRRTTHASLQEDYEKRLKEFKDRLVAIEAFQSSQISPRPASMSPGVRQGVCSSCGSTPLDVDESNAIHVVDFITSCVPVKLYIQQQWTTDKVAIGQAWPPTSDVLHNNVVPPRYAKVRRSALTGYCIRDSSEYTLSAQWRPTGRV